MPRPSNLPSVSTVVIGNALIAVYNLVTEVPAMYQKDEQVGISSPEGLNPSVFPNYSALGSTFLSADSNDGNVNRPPWRFQISNLPKPTSQATLIHWLTHWGGNEDDFMNLYRSLDGGITWELSFRNVQNFDDNIGIPTVGPDGTLWMIAEDVNTGIAIVHKSTSQGELDSWQATTLSIDVFSGDYDIFSQSGIVVDPRNSNKVVIVLNKFSSTLIADIPVFFVTEDGGDSWVEIEYPDRISDNVAGFQNIAFLPSGRLVNVIESRNPDDLLGPNQLIALYSDDPASGFEEIIVDPSGGWGNDPINGALQVIDENRLICTFNPGSGVDKSIYASLDRAETWAKLVDLPENETLSNAYYDIREDALYIVETRVGAPAGEIVLARLSQPFDGNTEWEDLSDAFSDAVGFPKEEITSWYGAAITAAS